MAASNQYGRYPKSFLAWLLDTFIIGLLIIDLCTKYINLLLLSKTGFVVWGLTFFFLLKSVHFCVKKIKVNDFCVFSGLASGDYFVGLLMHMYAKLDVTCVTDLRGMIL